MTEALTQGLSDTSKEILSKYFAWAKKQQSSHMKDIEADVKDVLNGLTTILKVTIEKEQRDNLNCVGEVLRQCLLGADKAGVKCEIDMGVLDDPNSLGSLANAFSGASLLKKTNLLAPASNKLPDIKVAEAQAAANEDLIKMKDERDKLADKCAKIQQQYTLMMQEKSKLTQEVNKLRDAATAGDAAIQAKAKEMEDEMSVLRGQLEKKDAELAGTAKELTGKVNNTGQFKTLKKLLTQKNQQVKQLRAALLKYEPQSGGIEIEDDESTDED